MMREEETLEDKSCYEQRIENTFQTIQNRNTPMKKKKDPKTAEKWNFSK